VATERKLPGLAAWGRVADYRTDQLARMGNVEIYRGSRLSADEILGLGFEHVAVATGSTWRADGIGRRILAPIAVAPETVVLTPDDLMAGARPAGRSVLIFDDDHYYMGGVLAELLALEGFSVTVVTPAADVSNWMHMTMEQLRVQARLVELGVGILPHRLIVSAAPGEAVLASIFSGRPEPVAADAVVLVTARLPRNEVAIGLAEAREAWPDAGIKSVSTIGDALAPGIIAAAVFSGRRYAEELEAPPIGDAVPFRREVAALAPWEGSRQSAVGSRQ
jgi:dimethylamine/trimethylamine dehydrogenase